MIINKIHPFGLVFFLSILSALGTISHGTSTILIFGNVVLIDSFGIDFFLSKPYYYVKREETRKRIGFGQKKATQREGFPSKAVFEITYSKAQVEIPFS